jgi:hypothetical protein
MSSLPSRLRAPSKVDDSLKLTANSVLDENDNPLKRKLTDRSPSPPPATSKHLRSDIDANIEGGGDDKGAVDIKGLRVVAENNGLPRSSLTAKHTASVTAKTSTSTRTAAAVVAKPTTGRIVASTRSTAVSKPPPAAVKRPGVTAGKAAVKPGTKVPAAAAQNAGPVKRPAWDLRVCFSFYLSLYLSISLSHLTFCFCFWVELFRVACKIWKS